MSYEYQITSNGDAKETYIKIKFLLENSTEYLLVFADDYSSAFKSKTSPSNWDADVDLSFSNDVVFLAVHSGNAKNLLKLIDMSLAGYNVNIEER